MTMNYFKIFMLLICFISNSIFGQNNELISPNGKLKVILENTDGLYFSISFKGITLIKKARLGITIDNKLFPPIESEIRKIETNRINEKLIPLIPIKSSQVRNLCNEMIIKFNNEFEVVLRAYDNGFAYRFKTDIEKDIIVNDELIEINFSDNYNTYFPEEESFISHFERIYQQYELNSISHEQFCSLPLLIDCESNIKIAITESALSDYPNLFLKGSSSTKLSAIFPNYVLETKPAQAADRNEIITKEANYIALTKGEREFPWRIFMVSENDHELVENQLVFILSEPQELKETDWIKPGKVAWDWWNALNIYGVDFKSGINTNTYKYYIDFASKYGIEYIILDEGWTKTTTNILEANPNIDLPELFRYGHEKNVGIILWVLWKPLYKNLESALDKYREWGAKGIKVDFMQRADQWMVNYYEKVLSEAAERKLLVDFHGSFKPAGFFRKYPNFISNEGVKGLENVKWSEDITPDHDCTLPFTRMLAGPMDFTPGAMINSEQGNFKVLFEKPMSQGTRAHQIALYIVFESPLQMLCDNPSNYLANKSSTEFISQIPTTWDTTIALEGKVGDYLLIARKKNEKWYIGGITDWTEREFEIEFDFLDKKIYEVFLASDGINSNRYASDIKFETHKFKSIDKLKIKMGKGGGFAAILSPLMND